MQDFSQIEVERRPNGEVILTNREPLRAHPSRAADAVLRWAAATPDAPAIGERDDAGGWAYISYSELAAASGAVAQSLLELCLGSETPLPLISRNSIRTAILILACYRAGIPVAPITPAYAGPQADLSRLGSIIGILDPEVVFVDRRAYAQVLRQVCGPRVRIFSLFADGHSSDDFFELALSKSHDRLLAAESAVTPDSIAKLLFSSGTTGAPKGVVNTHRMLTSNQQALRQAWPLLEATRPRLVDWLPWSHTFGGNFVFGLALDNGGVLHIDGGLPTSAGLSTTLENIRATRPNIYLNVPRGLELIGSALLVDDAMAKDFFAELKIVFYASAGLPGATRELWRDLIQRHAAGRVQLCSAWGLTETAPLVTTLNFDTEDARNIGVPIPGCRLKLAYQGERLELRVAGPNVTPGYIGAASIHPPQLDEEGYLKTGDAAELADSARPAKGLLFTGRIAEDFKTSAGVWVNAGGIRAQLIDLLMPAIREVVLSGPDRDGLGVLLFLDEDGCARRLAVTGSISELAENEAVHRFVKEALARYNRLAGGSSRRVGFYWALGRHPDPTRSELTEKGSVNQRAVLLNEAQLCDALHASPPGLTSSDAFDR